MEKHREKKQLISADGTPYTVWQRRTRVLCILLAVYAVLVTAVGVLFVALFFAGVLDLSDYASGVSVGPSTIVSGVLSGVVAIAGLWGAHNPQRITLFFWAVFLDALLNAWQAASLWSQGLLEPGTLISLAISLAYAVCAWNVRGQTGYFDNHPHPDDPDELPLERDARILREKAEGNERLEEVLDRGEEAVQHLENLVEEGEHALHRE